jgi:hypothetical protein
MTGAASPFALTFAPFICPTGSTVVRAAYYDGAASLPVWEATYSEGSPPPSNLDPLGSAFTHASGIQMGLETCVILEAQSGISDRGKPVYLRKYIHAAVDGNLAMAGDGCPNWDFISSVNTIAQSMGNGTWFGSRVYISPSGRQPAASAWTALVAPGNHQMPRGRKKKVLTGGAGASILSKLEGLAAALAAAESAL